jgi:hypothetical protein
MILNDLRISLPLMELDGSLRCIGREVWNGSTEPHLAACRNYCLLLGMLSMAASDLLALYRNTETARSSESCLLSVFSCDGCRLYQETLFLYHHSQAARYKLYYV